jgi:hypothetical protein
LLPSLKKAARIPVRAAFLQYKKLLMDAVSGFDPSDLNLRMLFRSREMSIIFKDTGTADFPVLVQCVPIVYNEQK